MKQKCLFVSFNWMLLWIYTKEAQFYDIITDKMI